MPTQIHRFVEEARKGSNPRVVCRLPSGWVMMGEISILPGYCLLLPDPVVPHLNALVPQARSVFLDDMSRVGDAILRLTDAARINYEMLGNLEPALHAHIIPRYDSEENELRTKPIWFYDWSKAGRFDERECKSFMEKLAKELRE